MAVTAWWVGAAAFALAAVMGGLIGLLFGVTKTTPILYTISSRISTSGGGGPAPGPQQVTEVKVDGIATPLVAHLLDPDDANDDNLGRDDTCDVGALAHAVAANDGRGSTVVAMECSRWSTWGARRVGFVILGANDSATTVHCLRPSLDWERLRDPLLTYDAANGRFLLGLLLARGADAMRHMDAATVFAVFASRDGAPRSWTLVPSLLVPAALGEQLEAVMLQPTPWLLVRAGSGRLVRRVQNQADTVVVDSAVVAASGVLADSMALVAARVPDAIQLILGSDERWPLHPFAAGRTLSTGATSDVAAPLLCVENKQLWLAATDALGMPRTVLVSARDCNGSHVAAGCDSKTIVEVCTPNALALTTACVRVHAPLPQALVVLSRNEGLSFVRTQRLGGLTPSAAVALVRQPARHELAVVYVQTLGNAGQVLRLAVLRDDTLDVVGERTLAVLSAPLGDRVALGFDARGYRVVWRDGTSTHTWAAGAFF